MLGELLNDLIAHIFLMSGGGVMRGAWMPSVAILGLLWLLSRTQTPRPLVVTLAFAMGLVVPMLVGGVALVAMNSDAAAGIFMQVGPDIVITAAICAWVYFKRSKASLYVLIALELLAGALTLLQAVSTGNYLNAIMFVHIPIRIVVVVSAIYSITQMPRPESATDVSTAPRSN